MASVITTYRAASVNAALHRRMCRILAAMIEGGAMIGKYDGELVTEGGRWYVGITAVNPAAARRLLQLNLMRLVSVNHCQSYELPENVRQRIAQMRLAARQDGETLAIDTLCTLLIEEASAREGRRDARLSSQQKTSGVARGG